MSELRAVFDLCIELGINVFDTSNVYGQGDSEREIGRALRGRRDKGFVVTKLGKTFSAKAALVRPFKPLVKALLPQKSRGQITARRGDHVSWSLDTAQIPETLNASLRRLGSDYVDGLLLHSPPAAIAADPAVADALRALKAAGKVRHFGVSCDDMATLEAAMAIPGLSLLQLPPDILAQATTSGLAQRFQAQGVGVMLREVIRTRPDLSPPQAVKLAVQTPHVTSVIVGVSSRQRLNELVSAL